MINKSQQHTPGSLLHANGSNEHVGLHINYDDCRVLESRHHKRCSHEHSDSHRDSNDRYVLEHHKHYIIRISDLEGWHKYFQSYNIDASLPNFELFNPTQQFCVGSCGGH